MRTEHLTTIGGHARGYSVHTPDAPPAARRTILFVLHGSYEDADGDAHVLYPVKRFERNYDTALFAPLRESEMVVTVYLAARYHARWFCWEGGGGEYDLCSLPRTGDDEALLSEALVTAEARAGGAAGRTFLFGMSGGAFQAWSLGCSTTGLLDGIGVVAGALAPSRRVCCCDVPHAVRIPSVPSRRHRRRPGLDPNPTTGALSGARRLSSTAPPTPSPTLPGRMRPSRGMPTPTIAQRPPLLPRREKWSDARTPSARRAAG